MNTNQKRIVQEYASSEKLFDRISEPNSIKNIGIAYNGIKVIPNYKELINNGNLLDAVIMHTFMITPKEELQESLL